ncbi:hypothetical protein GCM10029992_13430 [Glycomyces albus]
MEPADAVQCVGLAVGVPGFREQPERRPTVVQGFVDAADLVEVDCEPVLDSSHQIHVVFGVAQVQPFAQLPFGPVELVAREQEHPGVEVGRGLMAVITEPPGRAQGAALRGQSDIPVAVSIQCSGDRPGQRHRILAETGALGVLDHVHENLRLGQYPFATCFGCVEFFDDGAELQSRDHLAVTVRVDLGRGHGRRSRIVAEQTTARHCLVVLALVTPQPVSRIGGQQVVAAVSPRCVLGQQMHSGQLL